MAAVDRHLGMTALSRVTHASAGFSCPTCSMLVLGPAFSGNIELPDEFSLNRMDNTKFRLIFGIAEFMRKDRNSADLWQNMADLIGLWKPKTMSLVETVNNNR